MARWGVDITALNAFSAGLPTMAWYAEGLLTIIKSIITVDWTGSHPSVMGSEIAPTGQTFLATESPPAGQS
jgi:hypothetical protein